MISEKSDQNIFKYYQSDKSFKKFQLIFILSISEVHI